MGHPRVRTHTFVFRLYVLGPVHPLIHSLFFQRIVDLHSHLGDSSSPELNGAVDDNSLKGTTQPWLRSLDGLNTHDESFALSISGGVTTALVLPGSANAIGKHPRSSLQSASSQVTYCHTATGGQGFTIKLRKTAEHSPSSMLLEPPYQINSSFLDVEGSIRWRQMKYVYDLCCRSRKIPMLTYIHTDMHVVCSTFDILGFGTHRP